MCEKPSHLGEENPGSARIDVVTECFCQSGWHHAGRLTVYGEQTPRGSRAEIEALAAIPGMSSLVLPLGKLSFYEEFPDATAGAISPFLAEGV
jgi:hypothetical protein